MSHDEYHEVVGSYPELGPHTKGDWVTYAQQKLAEAGYLPPGQPDGMFGEHTHEAVREFQSAYGLMADGLIGPHTWAALDSVGADVGTSSAAAAAAGSDAAGAAGHGAAGGAGGHAGGVSDLKFAQQPCIDAGALVWKVYNAGTGVVPRGTHSGSYGLYHGQEAVPYSSNTMQTERDLHPNEVSEEFGMNLIAYTADNGQYQAWVQLNDETVFAPYTVANGKAHAAS